MALSESVLLFALFKREGGMGDGNRLFIQQVIPWRTVPRSECRTKSLNMRQKVGSECLYDENFGMNGGVSVFVADLSSWHVLATNLDGGKHL